jgi:hypothetical protein
MDSAEWQILAVDEWTFGLHSGPTGRKYCSFTPTGSAKLVHMSAVGLDSYDKFVNLVQKLLLDAQIRKGGARSAASNEQGHQKTPVRVLVRTGCLGVLQ